VTGVVNSTIFEDNRKAWSGDHCIDPKIVPGIIFSNFKLNTQEPSIIDIAPTALELFGIKVPPHMDGRVFIDTETSLKPS
jgi:bisphosphoglycerate-independent phosphoglycerate mutase (AlkP superfamily)